MTKIQLTTAALVVVVIINVVLAGAYLWDATHEAEERTAQLTVLCEGLNDLRNDNVDFIYNWASSDGEISARDQAVISRAEAAYMPEECPPAP